MLGAKGRLPPSMAQETSAKKRKVYLRATRRPPNGIRLAASADHTEAQEDLAYLKMYR